MISFIRALILVLLILYMAIIYESTSLALLGFAGAVLLVCSFVYLFFLRTRVEGDIHIPIAIAEHDRPFFVQALIHNRFVIPLTKVRVTVRYGESLERKFKKVHMVLKQRKNREITEECRVTICEPGNYVFLLDRIRIYDVTGLFYITKREKAKEHALVLPEPTAIPVSIGERVRNFFGDADTFDDLRPGYDPSETFDVREFRDGDRLQSVHWKLSAKSDELVVKESSLPKACPVVFFLTPCRANWRKQLVMITSLSYSLMDASCPHFVVWNSKAQKDLIRTRVDDEESFYMFLTTFMQDAVFDGDVDPEEEYRRKYRGEFYLHELRVNHDGIPVLNKTPVIRNEKEQIELLLK